MRVSVIRPAELTAESIESWRTYQQANPSLDSPFFSPEYAQAFDAVRQDVRTGVVESDGRVIGFFPFQIARWKVGRPVGLGMCDFTGVITEPGSVWDPRSLVRQCGLAAWNFQGVPASLQQLAPFHRLFGASPYLDLRDGIETYLRERRTESSGLVQELGRKSRKLEREIGPVHFEFRARGESALETLRNWKSAQRRRTATRDVLREKWAMELLDRLLAIETPEFGGVLSALYAGDDLAAVHFGVRSRTVLHYWFPTYNRNLQKYSPGSILLLELAKACASIGIERIDLGPGDESYKARFRSGAVDIGAGAVDCTLARRLVTPLWFGTRAWVRNSSIRPVLRKARRIVRRASYLAGDRTE